MSFIGVVVLILLAVLLSSNRRAIKLQTVVGAFVLQAGLGAFALYVPWGQATLAAISESVARLQDYGNEGISFVFGPLAGSQMSEVFGSQGFVFAIKVLPLIVFFSSFIAILYYLGIMSVVIRVIGGGLQRALGTSRTESMSATANIFVSQSEAPIVVRPFLDGMTRSELFAVMVGGMASVAGSVLIGYASLGVELKYLIAASFMAAPGGLLMAKLMEPQTAEPRDSFSDIEVYPDDKPANVIDAAALGVSNGLQLALNVGAMLLAFIALIAMLNGILAWVGNWFGFAHLSLQLILGHVFAPLAFVLGVPWSEAMTAGSFIGEKLVLNEFVAYVDFAAYLDPVQAAAKGIQVLSGATQVIVTFALCGFANLSSIGILLGSLGVMAPSRRQDIARLGLRAVIAGTLSNLMSAALAGVFISL
ncbi:NupC/NupG family nucleoside CNT transporter [Pseudomonas fragi]|uniref:NupC/NupG family nucleoside CNT transporter n=1 Tax=Pseudomonas fragi TaxID=296 RepID=UPI001F408678|nr:NupC/NupG family nucleoside CNT transporter [Pseudomonas fragi]MCF6763714.1 NupC/NupG family nucleoside CNT transporter [Pseudomonas fragi]